MTAYARQLHGKGKAIGFVPTMGYLHQGHLSLVRRARKENDAVVISIFVNPTQFGPEEDLEKYPRDFRRDRRLAAQAGVDVIFYPDSKAIYPFRYHTYVNVESLTDSLCGALRPGHFRGVATVVTKLFNIVQPDRTYFGQKDAQQARVIQQMVSDLNMPVNIKVLPTVREGDGLAMSSRNAYLNEQERLDARVLYQSLLKAKELIAKGERNPSTIKAVMRGMIVEKKRPSVEYVAIVDADSLKDCKVIEGRVLIAVAVNIGTTRLIDNIIVRV
jgi:pantoate--beta-alanine ligase